MEPWKKNTYPSTSEPDSKEQEARLDVENSNMEDDHEDKTSNRNRNKRKILFQVAVTSNSMKKICVRIVKKKNTVWYIKEGGNDIKMEEENVIKYGEGRRKEIEEKEIEEGEERDRKKVNENSPE